MSKLKGHIKLHRKIVNWRWFKEPNTVVVWLAILANVEWRKRAELKPGQWFTTVKELCEITGLKPQQVRTALNHLTNGTTNEITIKSTNKGSLITVENWRFYQMNPRQATNDSTNESTSNLTNLPLYEEVEEVKEGQNGDGDSEGIPTPMPEEFKQQMANLFGWNRKDN